MKCLKRFFCGRICTMSPRCRRMLVQHHFKRASSSRATTDKHPPRLTHDVTQRSTHNSCPCYSGRSALGLALHLSSQSAPPPSSPWSQVFFFWLRAIFDANYTPLAHLRRMAEYLWRSCVPIHSRGASADNQLGESCRRLAGEAWGNLFLKTNADDDCEVNGLGMVVCGNEIRKRLEKASSTVPEIFSFACSASL